MNAILEIPKLPSTVVLDPPLTDEEFEKLCAANDFARLERTKEGKILVNSPAGGDTSGGFFLPDGSVLNPDTAYATEEQMRGLTKEGR